MRHCTHMHILNGSEWQPCALQVIRWMNQVKLLNLSQLLFNVCALSGELTRKDKIKS